METDDPIDIENESENISLRFIEQDNFTQRQEFKNFWIRYKMRDFEERKNKRIEGIDESQHASVVQQMMEELYLDDISCTKEEEREMVRRMTS